MPSFPGEGIGYPLQYFWASLVAQMLKNPPAMWEIWVWSLGWEDCLEEGMATHSSILAWRTPMDRGAWWATVHGVTMSWTWLNTKHIHMPSYSSSMNMTRCIWLYNFFFLKNMESKMINTCVTPQFSSRYKIYRLSWTSWYTLPIWSCLSLSLF